MYMYVSAVIQYRCIYFYKNQSLNFKCLCQFGQESNLIQCFPSNGMFWCEVLHMQKAVLKNCFVILHSLLLPKSKLDDRLSLYLHILEEAIQLFTIWYCIKQGV